MPQSLTHSWQFRLVSWLALFLLSYTITSPTVESRTTRGGGKRGNCPEVAIPLTALMPVIATNAKRGEIRDAIISARPTFWFYVPYSPNFWITAEFVLIDGNENDVYATTFLLQEQPGVIGIPIPKNAPPLQINQHYRWVFSMICDRSNRSGDVTIDGTIERVAIPSTLQTQLTRAKTVREKTAIYTRNGLWNEAVTHLAQLRRANLTDQTLQNEWKLLLQAMGLNELNAAALTMCCTPETKRKP